MLFDFSYKLNPEERLVGLARKHWFFIAVPVLNAFLIILFLIVFVNRMMIFRQTILVSALLGLVFILYSVYKWVIWRADFYVITNERIIKISQEGILDKSIGEAGFKEIGEVFLETKGLAANIFRFGTIKIYTKSNREFKLENISNSVRIYQAIIKLKEHAQLF